MTTVILKLTHTNKKKNDKWVGEKFLISTLSKD